MTIVRQQFRAQPMAANTSVAIGGMEIGGFLCVTAGTITVTAEDGTVLVNAFPVAAGQWYPLPFLFPTMAGGRIQLAGGASGTLGV